MDETNQSTSDVDPTDAIADLLNGESDSGETEEPTTEDETPESDDIEETEAVSDDEESEPTDNEDDVVNEDPEEDETLASMFGIEDDKIIQNDDKSISVNVKVNGKSSIVSMKDMIAGYQNNKSNTVKSQALAEERKGFDQQIQQQQQYVNQLAERNQNIAKILENELVSEFQGVDWEDLRQYDPAEFVAKERDYKVKYQKLNRLQEELSQQHQQEQNQQQANFKQQQGAYLEEQREVMLNSNPQWRNKETFTKDMKGMSEFAVDTYGYNLNELDNINDSRVIEVLKDAMAYRNGKKFATKRQKVVPKYHKSGGVKRKPKTSKLDKLTKIAKSSTGSNARDAQVDAIAELFN